MIRLLIDLGLPSPEKLSISRNREEEKKQSLEEQVRCMLQKCDSDERSETEWRSLKLLYKQLLEKHKENPRAQAVMRLLEPHLRKYGYHVHSKESPDSK